MRGAFDIRDANKLFPLLGAALAANACIGLSERERRTPFSIKRAIIGAPQVRQSSRFR